MGEFASRHHRRLRHPNEPRISGLHSHDPEAAVRLAVKGKFDGNCNRSACQAPIVGANWWNSSTRAYYCGPCARDINGWSREDDGIVICTAVTDPNDQPPFPIVKGET